MRSFILLLLFVFPWLLVIGLAAAAVYVGINAPHNKDLLLMCAVGAGLSATFLALPTTFMVLAATEDGDKKDKK